MTFEAVQALEMPQFGHLVLDRDTGRCLGGAGHNFYKIWAFPLYTPRGLTVIQEYAFDHPFHNGIFVGHYPVLFNGRSINFWVAPPRRSYDDAVYVAIGRVDAAPPEIEVHEHGVRFVFNSVWRDENEVAVLDEVRTINLHTVEDATICDMTSSKTTAYGALEYSQTKLGGVGIRVEPRLLPALGGVVLADNERKGTTEIVHEGNSQFVAYENAVASHGRFGVCMMILDHNIEGPWFVRDYGMAMYNPTWRMPITTAVDETWTIGLRVIAYDDALTSERVQRWRSDFQ